MNDSMLIAHQVHCHPVTLNGSQLGLNLLLLDSGIGNLFNLLSVLQDVAFQQVLKLKHILSQLQFVACRLPTSCSMANVCNKVTAFKV